MKKYALLSVSDKTGIVELAQALAGKDYAIIATGNTAKKLKENGLEVEEASDLTGFPEIFTGRVKTLHPKIFGGILMRREREEDIKEAEANGVPFIDVVCVNLYPFMDVVNRMDKSHNEKLENIDIGGPSLIRASAKNYKSVSVLTDPAQYKAFIEELNEYGISEKTREKLAARAFAKTAEYDAAIAHYFEINSEVEETYLRQQYKKLGLLRYGENPHQQASLYGDFYEYYDVLHGKELSYNNIVDLAAAAELVYELGENSCAIIKHTNPCGAATAGSITEAYDLALSGDPVSSFGGIVTFNGEVGADTAGKLNEIFLEIVAAPSFTDEAMELLQKKKNRRIVKILKDPSKGQDEVVKSVTGGLLIQDRDNSSLDGVELKNVTKREYSAEELEDLKFAWVICKHTKSNAIVYVKDKKILGTGAGQMSRIDSARIAASKAREHGHELEGAVAASDAYFPFADGVDEIAANGIVAIIQPGGSVRDGEVIEAADTHNLTMVFTGIRNFKH